MKYEYKHIMVGHIAPKHNASLFTNAICYVKLQCRMKYLPYKVSMILLCVVMLPDWIEHTIIAGLLLHLIVALGNSKAILVLLGVIFLRQVSKCIFDISVHLTFAML